MKLAIPKGIGQGVATTILKTKKNSPHIFFAAGILGVIGSTVLACRATLKLEDTLDSCRADLEKVKDNHRVAGDGTEQGAVQITGEYRKEMGLVGLKGAYEVGKLYALPAVLGGLSIAALTGSHVQLTKRNTALGAALTATTKAFDSYRQRVRDEIGEEREFKIYRDITEVEVEDENGKKSKEQVIAPGSMSQYAVVFDPGNPQWSKDPERNKILIMAQQQYMNHKLNADGHVFLNEVYDCLGFPHTPIGQLVGWLKNAKNGDNYIDFGMFEGRNREFMHALEPNIWLDFNVDGVIYDQI